jgi:ADP-ribosylation factor-binding protein GGA
MLPSIWILIVLDIPGPALISSTTQYSTARGPTPTSSPAPPSQVTSKPDYTAFSAFGSSHPVSQSTTPQPAQFQQQQQQKPIIAASPQAPAADPFAALKASIQQSPPQQPQKSIFDFANPQPPVNKSAPVASTGDDDEWAFSSALPEGPPSSNTLTVSDTSLRISLHAAREPSTLAVITMSLSFSNKTAQPISELTFMAAVTKASQSRIISLHPLTTLLGILTQASAAKWTAATTARARRCQASNIFERSGTWSRRLDKVTMESVI